VISTAQKHRGSYFNQRGEMVTPPSYRGRVVRETRQKKGAKKHLKTKGKKRGGGKKKKGRHLKGTKPTPGWGRN